MKSNSNPSDVKLYEAFHRSSSLPRRIITKNNFTYFNIIKHLDNILSLLNKDKESQIIDYGCGVGTTSLYMANKGFSVLGLDVSNKAIKIAKQSAIKFNLKNIEFKRSQDLDTSAKALLITCFEVIEHVPNPKNLVSQMFSTTKHKGYLFLTTPAKSAPLYRWGLLSNFEKQVGHLRRFSKEELIALIVSSGYKVIWVKEEEGIVRNLLFTNSWLGKIIRFLRGPLSPVINFIDKLTIKPFGCSNYLVLAQKP